MRLSNGKETSLGSKAEEEKIEHTYSLSLREYCPTPRNQGQDANCVGWSVGYAAQTIRMAYVNKLNDQRIIDSLSFSPHFIYNNVKLKDCAMGAEIPEAFQFLIRTGNVSLRQFTEGSEDCFAVPNEKDFEDAGKNRINDFTKLFTPEDSKQIKIKEVKKALINGYPVVIAMNILKSFTQMKPGEQQWYSKVGSQVPVGGHALVVIGFDELKNAFEVMNSWGTEWADNGYAYINYNDFDTYARYGFTFRDQEKEPFATMIDFNRNIMITADGSSYFEKELFRWHKDRYILAAEDYQPNSTYRIKIYHSNKRYKLYCFNASGNTNYSELFRIDGTHRQLITDVKSYGLTLPPLEFTDPESERFVFIFSAMDLTAEELHSIALCSAVECVLELFSENINNERRILSYSRVAITSSLGSQKLIIPVDFKVK